MKRLLFIIFIVGFFYRAESQEINNKYIGINVSYTVSYVGLCVAPIIEFENKRHLLDFGVLFPTYLHDEEEYFSFFIGYNFYPNKSAQKFDFFFFNELYYEWHKEKYYMGLVEEKCIYESLGFGFRTTLYKNLYLRSKAGIAMGLLLPFGEGGGKGFCLYRLGIGYKVFKYYAPAKRSL